MTKLSEQARLANAERREALDQWEKTIEHSQNRGIEIEELFKVLASSPSSLKYNVD